MLPARDMTPHGQACLNRSLRLTRCSSTNSLSGTRVCRCTCTGYRVESCTENCWLRSRLTSPTPISTTAETLKRWLAKNVPSMEDLGLPTKLAPARKVTNPARKPRPMDLIDGRFVESFEGRNATTAGSGRKNTNRTANCVNEKRESIRGEYAASVDTV